MMNFINRTPDIYGSVTVLVLDLKIWIRLHAHVPKNPLSLSMKITPQAITSQKKVPQINKITYV